MALSEITILFIIILTFTLLAIVGHFLNLEKYGFFFFFFGFIWKTEIFNKVLKIMSDKGKKLWEIIYRIGLVPAIIASVILFGYFIVNPFLILTGSKAGVGLQLIIPGVTVGFETLLLFIIPIMLVLIPHEIGHAVMAHKEGVGVKSSGIFVFLLLFGGFVELIKEQMDQVKPIKRIKILLNGVSINAVVSILALILLLLLPFLTLIAFHPPNGVLIISVYEDMPAEEAGIEKGDVIKFVGILDENDTVIELKEIANTTYFNQLMASISGEPKLLIGFLEQKNITITPTNVNPTTNKTEERLFLGISIYDYYPAKNGKMSPFIPYYLTVELLYTANIGMMAVFINMLPMKITDGDRVLQELLDMKKVSEKKKKNILKVLRIVCVGILFLNIGLSMIMFRF